ncbi:MAG: efflux RND transporter periplasmic adaptor subunit [Chitinivibrionales bacterium]|nr:efflux RND transporter periplasmic adaptor subunit [Chitinivibrionales bacterium]
MIQLRVYGLIVLALASGCSRSVPEAEGVVDKPAVAVEALNVTSGMLNRSIEGSGTISGINEAFVVAETQGIIRSVRFELGDSVKKGQLLVKVDDEIARLNMEQAEQAYETAQMNRDVAEQLALDGTASKAESVKAASAYKGAKAAYEAAQKAYEDCSVRSPIAGYIAQKEATATVGNYLAAGSRVARVVDISSLKLEIALGEREISFIAEGAAAQVRVPAACREKVFDATVHAIAAGADPATGSFAVVLTWPNTCDKRIKSGMSANVSIETNKEEPVVLVPASAIIESDGRDAVITAVKKRAAIKYVRVGRKIGNKAEILEGLGENETIVISGLTSLSKGDKVDISVMGDSGEWQ